VNVRMGLAGLVTAAVVVGCSVAPGVPSASPTAVASPGGGAATACPTSQPPPLAAGQTRTVTLQTAKGAIVIGVDGALSPIAAGNFVALAACGFYDAVAFHRVVPGFVIQGGDGQFGRAPTIDRANVGKGGPGYTIADEPVTATYGRGVVAMARSSQPNSEGSQFFIVLSDAARDTLASYNTYAIFGHVTSGMQAVDAIAAAADAELPTAPVSIDHATVSNP
jgi:cyclophilin family peptidyl-prolyl cis-trans isomerase